MTQPQAGWYPSPSGEVDKLRYWDGVQWTDSYMDNPQTAATAAVEAAAAAQEQTDPLWAQASGASAQQPGVGAAPQAGYASQADYAQQAQAQAAQPGAAPQQPNAPYCQPTYVQPTYIQQPQQPYTQALYPMTKEDQTLRLIAFIFNVVFTVGAGFAIIPLAWMIPITVRSWGIYKGTKPNTITLGVLDLIFCSFISGILLLVSTKDE